MDSPWSGFRSFSLDWKERKEVVRGVRSGVRPMGRMAGWMGCREERRKRNHMQSEIKFSLKSSTDVKRLLMTDVLCGCYPVCAAGGWSSSACTWKLQLHVCCYSSGLGVLQCQKLGLSEQRGLVACARRPASASLRHYDAVRVFLLGDKKGGGELCPSQNISELFPSSSLLKKCLKDL